MPPALQAELEVEFKGSRSLRRPELGGEAEHWLEDLPDRLSVAPEVRGPHTLSLVYRMNRTLWISLSCPQTPFH